MAIGDPRQAQEPTVQAPVIPLTDPIVEPSATLDIEARFNKLEETHKAEVAGLNRKNSEREKEVEQLKLDKLEGKERAEKELELLKTEKERILAETGKIKIDRLIEKSLIDSELPVEFANRIKGDDEANIKEDVQKFKTFIDAQIEKGVEAQVNARLAGKGPEAGAKLGDGTEREKLIAQYNEAEKAGDAKTMTMLKGKIHSLPKPK